MLFSIDLLYENIIKFVLEIFDANLFKVNHAVILSNSTLTILHIMSIFSCLQQTHVSSAHMK